MCNLRLSRLGLLIFCLVLGSAFQATQAVEPQVNIMVPYGLQRGAETEVVVNGGRLADAKELLFYGSGFQVTSFEATNDGSCKAKVVVSPDCRLGIHAMRVRTSTGISNLRTFTVGPLPEAKEVEPNSDFAKPQVIANNVTVSGVIENEDVDYFQVELKKGERLTAELEGLRLGYFFFDPYLAILNSARFEIARSDDAALLNQDCLCSVVAPEDGKYIVQVRESSFGGNGACAYRVHIGGYPRPTAVFPAGGRPGETLDVRWIGDAAGDIAAKITLPTDGVQETGMLAQDAGGVAASPNMMRVIDIPNTLEVEPNDAIAQATVGAIPGAFNGIIATPGETDMYKFTAKAGQQLDIRVYARKPLRSPLDSVLYIYNAQGGVLAGNDDAVGPDSYLRFAVPADGDYHLGVLDQLRSGGPNFVYRIEVVPVAATLTMVLPERQQYIPTTLVVPKNNRMALLVTASRANFGGPIDLQFGGLPAGLTADAVPLTAEKADTPVLFTAAADAAPAGALLDVTGTYKDANQTIVGHLNQRCMLVRGQNNVDVWGHDAQKMAMVLSDEVPFKIDIVQPKAPLVKNGSMNLKVVATRAAGFTAPISLGMLYNPPGVGSSGSIVIPEGQNEASIPLTANGGAAVGNWKIVVIGRAGHLGGTIEASTQLADLAISEQFFNFAFDKSAVEQGQQTEVVVKVEKKIDFEGAAKCELVGLPAGTTTTAVEFNKDTAELVFKVVAAKEARAGKYPSLVCIATFLQNGDTVTHTLGTGELRVDEPLPPKVAAPAPAPMPVAAAAPAAAPAPMEKKRLSRLEQLRLDKEQAAGK